MKLKGKYIFISVMLGSVLAVMIAGFFSIDSPAAQRSKQADELRVTHLKAIRSAVNAYWMYHVELPATLDDLDLRQYRKLHEGIALIRQDPRTGQPYTYSRSRAHTSQDESSAQYTLCAIFETEDRSRMDPAWEHPAGYHCFEFRVNMPEEPTVRVPETPQAAKTKIIGQQVTTYTHPRGYEISYPADWSLRTSDPGDGAIYVYIRKDPIAQVPDGYSEPCPDGVVGISVAGPFPYWEEFGTFDKLVNHNYDKDGSLGKFGGKKAKRSINGLLAYVFESYALESVCAGPGYLIRLNSKEYLTVHLILNVLNEENVKLASQIAESIKRTKK